MFDVRFETTRTWVVCLVMGIGGTVAAASEPDWVLENATLRVEILASEHRFEVVDQRTGRRWHSREAGWMSRHRRTRVRNGSTVVPRLRTPPGLNGRLDDWDSRCEIAFSAAMATAEGRPYDDADLQVAAQLAAGPDGLWIGVRVTDDRLVRTSATRPRAWWLADSIEFWLGGTQYAVLFDGPEARLWCDGPRPEGMATVVETTVEGYVAEVLVPWHAVPLADRKLTFALGVNDSDGFSGRHCQLYFPEGWRHSVPSTRATFEVAEATPAEPSPEGAAELPVLTGDPQAGSGSGQLQLLGGAVGPEGVVPLRLGFSLVDGASELVVTCAAVGDGWPGDLQPFPALSTELPGLEILATPYGNGLAVPVTDLTWDGQRWETWNTAMPWVGLTNGSEGMMVIWDLPETCDNGVTEMVRMAAGAADAALAPAVRHAPVLGRAGPVRRVRYAFFADGGHVSICKRYRDAMRRTGRLVTLAEKAADNPVVGRLGGAAVFWEGMGPGVSTVGSAVGIDRALRLGPPTPTARRRRQHTEHLSGSYANYTDVFEGDPGIYGDANPGFDLVLDADGAPVDGWLTHGTPPKQFSLRCSARQEAALRRDMTASQAEARPDVRLLGAAASRPLAECFSGRHGLTRSGDRGHREGLLVALAGEFGAVAGVEQGRWWAARHAAYLQGMQSGGFFSWPAQHIGEAVPATADEVDALYRTWGVGLRRRLPLWELVFHDCAVSTWYWGDSSGCLNAADPGISDRKDALNILYGTVPLFWTDQPFGYRWDLPAARDRLLVSYCVTSRLHRRVFGREMLSHERLDPEGSVQRTRFAGGTTVTVNGGPDDAQAIRRDGTSVSLPANGFMVTGEAFDQSRIRGRDGRVRTVVRDDDVLFVQGETPGLVVGELGRFVALVREAPRRVRLVTAADTGAIRIHRQILGRRVGGTWLLGTTGDAGEFRALERLRTAGEWVCLPRPQDPLRPRLLVAAEAAPASGEFAVRAARARPSTVSQGQGVWVTAQVAHLAGRPSPVTVRLFRGEYTPGGRARCRDLLDATVLRPTRHGTRTVRLQAPTSRWDGDLPLCVTVGRPETELCARDNLAVTRIQVRPDTRRWDFAAPVRVALPPYASRNVPVQLRFEPCEQRETAGLDPAYDPDSLRVVVRTPAGESLSCPGQFAPGDDGEPALHWILPGTWPAGARTESTVLLDATDGATHTPLRGGRWNPLDRSVTTPAYRARFEEGVLTSVSSAASAGRPILHRLCASSEETGWLREEGTVTEFEVLDDGPVLTRIRVRKVLAGDHVCDKVYRFYPDRFLVTVLSTARFGTLSRAFYAQPCSFIDDKGTEARIDGTGGDEGVDGRNYSPKWYLTWTPDWTLTCVAMSTHTDLTYWDGVGMGSVGFDASMAEPATVGYLFGVGDEVGDEPLDYGAEQALRLGAGARARLRASTPGRGGGHDR